MGTFEPSGDDVRAYVESAHMNIGEEGAKAPEPQETEIVHEEGVEAPEPQGTEQQPQEQQYEVTVDGEQQQVSLEELQQGYERRASFTQKSQQLAAERAAFEAERAAQLANRSPGLGPAPSGPYDPWGFPAAAPAVVPGPYGQPEQAAGGITGGEPAARSGPDYAADPSEPITRADLLAFRQQIAAENSRAQEVNRQVFERMQKERAESAALASLAQRYPDFDQTRCMEHFYRLPYYEQQRLRSIPRSAAMELIHLQTRQQRAPQAPAKQEARPPKVPYSEPSRNVPTRGTSSAAAKEAPPTSDRQALGDWWLQSISTK